MFSEPEPGQSKRAETDSQPNQVNNQADSANFFNFWGFLRIEKRVAYQLILAVIATLIVIALATAFFSTFHW
ncbi:unnamed protein product [Bursaphelenchus xylophilus]|uniref:(pine wood nematode) hypothetical protein n=1 Tax=Bursaphelenchus xylophilus TaxID=6326 RepID=A0A1I7RKG4_BURXY|nr:unnamed protein product [Bursaphelenchus xylophilus]CAG9131340.1 unnamed protein product [Bursaphelenchus xylophilus]